MKGRNQFTTGEMGQLREILKSKENATGKQQKPFRDGLRSRGFYITDFDNTYKGFTAEDLDELVKSGIIRIVDGKSN
jgi:chromosome segregation and condensation protein ScpB